MANKYQLLENLEQLYKAGTISEEEYRKERQKIMDDELPQSNFGSDLFGMSENSYLMVMHLSQFAGLITVGLGFVVPLIMWLLNKENNKVVDRHGQNILNFMISWLIYYAVAFLLIISFILSIVGLPLAIILGITQIIFIIIAAINANDGKYWEYPLSIKFFNDSGSNQSSKYNR